MIGTKTALCIAFTSLVAASPATRVASKPSTLPRVKSMHKPLAAKRDVSAKASIQPGYEHLNNLNGKVYDNILFRQSAGWDPYGFLADANKDQVLRMREAEIVHGRMAMLAAAGELLAEIHHPIFPTASGTALEQFQAVGKLCGPMFLYGFMAHVHAQEALRFSGRFKDRHTLAEGQEPGAYDWDPLGLAPKNEEAKAKRQNQELNNGRLAMLASLGILAEEYKTGVPVMDKIGIPHF